MQHLEHCTTRRGLCVQALALTSPTFLTSCSNTSMNNKTKLQYHADQKPRFNLQQYFNGTLDAYGMFSDRSGKVIKRFSVLMVCSWQGNTGILDESFTYSDGSTQKRIWHLTKLTDGSYQGRADDVVGMAVGEENGNAFHWEYTLNLPVDGKTYEVQFDDWMHLVTPEVMLNTAKMSKWGFNLGQVTLSFHKRIQSN